MGGARKTGAPSGLALAPRSNDPSTPRTRSTHSPARKVELVPRGQRNGEILVADRENDSGAVAVHSCTSSTVGYAVGLHRYLSASEESPTRGQTPPRSLLEPDIGVTRTPWAANACARTRQGSHRAIQETPYSPRARLAQPRTVGPRRAPCSPRDAGLNGLPAKCSSRKQSETLATCGRALRARSGPRPDCWDHACSSADIDSIVAPLVPPAAWPQLTFEHRSRIEPLANCGTGGSSDERTHHHLQARGHVSPFATGGLFPVKRFQETH
jgi:hypothetical protein